MDKDKTVKFFQLTEKEVTAAADIIEAETYMDLFQMNEDEAFYHYNSKELSPQYTLCEKEDTKITLEMIALDYWEGNPVLILLMGDEQ
ncbi:hypothetical protein ACIGC1_27940 [Peribacillus butanolivorans]|uniref:hypothetical protein n=1 Tax=Peribacillus butanolivorans TaxID=421767 RepID=UPI0037CBD72C